MASTTPASQPQPPRLRLRRATKADVPTIVQIHYAAFNEAIMNRLMFPDGGSPSARASLGGSLEAIVDAPPAEDPPATEDVLMVAERCEGEEGGEVVAFAKWRIVRETLAEEKWKGVSHDMTSEGLGEGARAEVYNTFVGGLHRLMATWKKGDPCVYLAILACSPSHQRLGAGTALVRWGVDLADHEDRVAWVEASPDGYPVYLRQGFEPVDVQDLDVKGLWGATRGVDENWGQRAGVEVAGELREGCFRTTIMKRMPRAVETGAA